MATDISFSTVDIPDMPMDETPPIDGADFDPEYPGSTPEAPYGFKPDGTAYRRRPRGSAPKSSGATSRRMPASGAQAEAAAGMLATLNTIIGVGFAVAGMPATAAAIEAGNDRFTELATQALLTDPALCKKIIGTGGTSGKMGLAIAYSTLGMSLYPVARMEIKSKREAESDDYRD